MWQAAELMRCSRRGGRRPGRLCRRAELGAPGQRPLDAHSDREVQFSIRKRTMFHDIPVAWQALLAMAGRRLINEPPALVACSPAAGPLQSVIPAPERPPTTPPPTSSRGGRCGCGHDVFRVILQAASSKATMDTAQQRDSAGPI